MLRDPPEIASRPTNGSRPTGWEALAYIIWIASVKSMILFPESKCLKFVGVLFFFQTNYFSRAFH